MELLLKSKPFSKKLLHSKFAISFTKFTKRFMNGLTFLSTTLEGQVSLYTAKSVNKYFWTFLKKVY